MTLVTPEIVFGIAALVFFTEIGISLGLKTILIAHVVFNASVVALVVRARFVGMGQTLRRGHLRPRRGPVSTFRQVTLPRLAPAILAGGLLAFTFSFDDFYTSFFVSGAGTTTLPLFIFSSLRFGVSPVDQRHRRDDPRADAGRDRPRLRRAAPLGGDAAPPPFPASERSPPWPRPPPARLQSFVGGDWVDSTGEHVREIVSPVTGETLAAVPDASATTSRARPGPRATRSRLGRARRGIGRAICHAIADLIDERHEEFARELALEQGKPFRAEALPDIDETAENFRIAAEDVKRMETAIIPSQDVNKRILTFRVANGVYACITPWNFPTLIPVELIAPAIAAGNTIVIKPSEWTPIAMANFMQIMADAGLPDGVVNVVYGGGEVGERLDDRRERRRIGFVGSHTTAEKIVRAAGLKRSLIEASGNGPVIVCADADLAQAAKGAVFGGFFCAGQVCCATERVLVDARVHDDFLAAVVEEARGWKLGDPFDDETLVGPMNNEPTARKMDAHLADAVEKGAKVVLGGSREADRPTRSTTSRPWSRTSAWTR